MEYKVRMRDQDGFFDEEYICDNEDRAHELASTLKIQTGVDWMVEAVEPPDSDDEIYNSKYREV